MSNRAKTFLLLIVDTFILFLALGLVADSRRGDVESLTFLQQHFSFFIYIFPVWILMYFIEGLYALRTYNPTNLAISLLRA